ncbi:MAG: ytgB [Parachlamydiales bacterium]|nr:ytgB [Parachlamydiales bacterium]
MNAIEIEGLTINYDQTSVLWDLSFSLPHGIICGIAGPNGAGKSTLLKAAVGLVKPQSGRIALLGQPLRKMRQRIAYIPQRESIDWDFPITASDVVLMGRYHQFGFWGRPRPADRAAAACALEQLGMSAFADRQISQLSGGQQQRLFIARALVQEPDLFLMDEPFRGVDLATEKSIIELLRRLKNEGKTILIVFHDLHMAQSYFDYLLLLNRRLIACGPIEATLNSQNISRAFGKSQSLFEEATALSAKTRLGMK